MESLLQCINALEYEEKANVLQNKSELCGVLINSGENKCGIVAFTFNF